MGQISILVCDECQVLGASGGADDIETWHISKTDGRARVDLCFEHSAPLRHLLDNYGESFNGTAPAGISKGHFESMISTMDEIAQLREMFIAKHGDVTLQK